MNCMTAVLRVVAVATLLLACLMGCTFGRLSSQSPRFTPAPVAAEGYATLYIFRPWQASGGAVWPVTFLNDVKIADVEALSYTYVYLRPGAYHVRTERSQLATAMGNRPFDFEIPATQTYYLQFGNSAPNTTVPIGGGGYVGIPAVGSWDWQLVTEARAMKVLAKTRYLPPYVQTLER